MVCKDDLLSFILKISQRFLALSLVVDKWVRGEDNHGLASILFVHLFFFEGVLNAGCSGFGNAVGR